MSTRPLEAQPTANPLRLELDEARAVAAEQQRAAQLPSEVLYSPELSNLSHDERQVVSLGVQPDAWRPISMLNTAHYTNLVESNAIAPALAAKLESFKAVASGS